MGDITQAVAVRQDGPESLIERYRDDLIDSMPEHVKGRTWLRAAHNALRTNADLMQAATRDPGSLMNALAEAAELGHRPGSDSYYLVPLGGKVEGWEGYKGLIERMYRSGRVASVVAEVVYERDEFSYSPGPGAVPHHVPYDGEDPGKIVRTYAYAQMTDGSVSKVVVLREKDVDRHRRMSKGHDKPSSPWQRTPEKMYLKSAVKDLSAWVPMSLEWAPRYDPGPVASAPARRAPLEDPGPQVPDADDGPIDAELVD